MFPFHFGNGFLNNNHLYPINNDVFMPSYLESSPYIPSPYPYINYNQLTPPQLNYYSHINHNLYIPDNRAIIQRRQTVPAQKKRIKTKCLPLLDIKKQIRQHYKQYKAKRKNFKYFDPSRAPPITSLRNKIQIQSQLHNLPKKTEKLQELGIKSHQKEVLKLQIMLQQPDQKQYPFLICKKRKYYRNLKRRYSVAYFEQRAHYIHRKIPIPPQLHPKNKVRKSRLGKNVNDENQNSSQYEDSEYSSGYDYDQKEPLACIKQEQNMCASQEEKSSLKKQVYDDKKSPNQNYSISLY